MFLLVVTGDSPESYEVRLFGERVGSFRVSYHTFRAECRGLTVYAAETEGRFRMSPDERAAHLREGCCAVLSALAAEGMTYWLYRVDDSTQRCKHTDAGVRGSSKP